MTRIKNPLSPVQLKPKLFAAVCVKISVLGPDFLAEKYNVGRTSIFKYKRKEAVDTRSEYLIYKALLTHDGIDPEGETDLVELAKMATTRRKKSLV